MFLKNFTNLTGKHLYQSLSFNKIVGLGLQLYGEGGAVLWILLGFFPLSIILSLIALTILTCVISNFLILAFLSRIDKEVFVTSINLFGQSNFCIDFNMANEMLHELNYVFRLYFNFHDKAVLLKISLIFFLCLNQFLSNSSLKIGSWEFAWRNKGAIRVSKSFLYMLKNQKTILGTLY